MSKITLLLFIFISIITSAQKGSKEKIYSSFTIINDGLEATRTLLAKETNKLYFNLVKAKSNDSVTVQLGDSIRKKSNDLISYINHVKILILIKTEKLEKEAIVENDTIISLKYLEHFDDYYTPGEILIGKDEWSPIKGKYTAQDLKIKLMNYNEYLKSSCYENSKLETFIDLNTNYYGTWETENFFEKPLAGIITYLSKLQLDIILTEQKSIKHLILTKSE